MNFTTAGDALLHVHVFACATNVVRMGSKGAPTHWTNSQRTAIGFTRMPVGIDYIHKREAAPRCRSECTLSVSGLSVV